MDASFYSPSEAEPATVTMDDVAEIRTQLFTSPGPAAGADATMDTTGGSFGEAAQGSALNVFLRIRPFSQKETASKEQPMAMKVSDKVIEVKPPKDAKAYKSGGGAPTKFSFTTIFDEKTGNDGFFQETARPLVANTLHGDNSLLFTYGCTNSGKTYTIQGVPEDPGALPRSLDVIFNSVGDSLFKTCGAKPRYGDKLRFLSDAETAAEIEERDRCLNFRNVADESTFISKVLSETARAAGDTSQLGAEEGAADGNSAGDSAMLADSSTDSLDLSNLRAMEEERLRIQDAIDDLNADGVQFAVFVSFLEIYNEYIYDLLVEAPKKQQRRAACKLAENNGDIFVKGNREFQVDNSDEAFRIMSFGLRNRKVASTRSNHESSRSHCIFMVKIAQISAGPQPEVLKVSRFSIVDLAGSERYTKTNATGARLKEAGNINTSLMTLGKCIEVLRHNQSRKATQQKIVPFRESKLTRLFQNYLSGRGMTTMVVNINKAAKSYDETAHVLKFSAVAKKVVVAPIASKIDTGLSTMRTEIQASLDQARLESAEVTDFNQKLLVMIEALQHQLAESERQIRDEVAAEMAEQLLEMEEQYQANMREQAETAESMYDQRLTLYTHSVARMPAKRRIQSDEASTGLEAEVRALKARLAEAQTDGAAAKAELEAVRTSLATLKEEAAAAIERKETNLNAKHDAEMEGLRSTLQEDLASNITKAAEKRLARMQAEVEQAETRQIAMSELVASLESEARAAKAQAQELEAGNEKLVARAEEAEAAAARMQELEAGKEKLVALAEETEAAAARVLELEAANGKLVARAEEAEAAAARVQELEAANGKLVMRAEIAEAAAADFEGTIGRLRADIKSMAAGHDDTVRTFSETVARLEADNDTLNTQLTDILEEQMASDLDKYATTSAETNVSRTASVLSNSGHVITPKNLKRKASALGAPREELETSRETKPREVTRDLPPTAAAASPAVVVSSPPAAADEGSAKGRKRCSSKRVSAAHSTAMVGRDLGAILLSPQHKAGVSKKNKMRKRRLNKKGDISSPLGDSNSNPRVKAIMTPIARRLRPRKARV